MQVVFSFSFPSQPQPVNMTSKLLFVILSILSCSLSMAFVPMNQNSLASTSRVWELRMGIFDGLMKAFDNASYSASPAGVKASARHILVKSKDDANMVLEKLSSGTSFASVAAQYSSCPSGSRGGSLGSFSPGTMVPAFDAVIFNPQTNIGEVVGPVETQFGYHLIVVDKRTGV
jgi:peptidyl-prolyl cis-trans isomerase C